MGFSINPANLVQTAMLFAAGPVAPAALALRILGPQVAMNAIQMAGNRMGIPQPMIDLAQAAFASAAGQPGLRMQNITQAAAGLAGQFNLDSVQQGQLTNQLAKSSNHSIDNISRMIDNILKKSAEGAGGGGEEGGSVLMKIARALGQLMDQKMDNLAAKADQLGRVGGEAGNTLTKGQGKGTFNAEGQSKFGKLSAEVQALSQEIGYLSQAIASTIKGIGEAASTVARK